MTRPLKKCYFSIASDPDHLKEVQGPLPPSLVDMVSFNVSNIYSAIKQQVISDLLHVRIPLFGLYHSDHHLL